MLKDVEEDNDVDGPEDNPETAQIKKWLVKVTPKKDISNLGVGNKSTNDNPNIKLKQMELEFVSIVSRMMAKPTPPTTATSVVEEAAPTMKKRRKTLKGLAKENAKVTDWISKKLDMSAEVMQEENLVEMRDDEIAMEAWRCRRMIKEMVHNLITMNNWMWGWMRSCRMVQWIVWMMPWSTPS